MSLSFSLSSCWSCNVSSSFWSIVSAAVLWRRPNQNVSHWRTDKVTYWGVLDIQKEKVKVKSKPSTRSRLINCSNACTPSLLGPLHKTRWSGKEKNTDNKREQKRYKRTQEEGLVRKPGNYLFYLCIFFCICQGCRRFLTISDPRWDQPISDIFI